jgi:hypothetical protein
MKKPYRKIGIGEMSTEKTLSHNLENKEIAEAAMFSQ